MWLIAPTLALCCLLLAGVSRLAAQSDQDEKVQSATSPGKPTAAMRPSEAFDYASQPFNEARAQPNDLTDADRWAFGVSVQRAAEACQALTPYKHFDEELLSVGRLCLLGQQYEPAAEALVPYLSVPDSKYEEAGILLSRAYIGMGQLAMAGSLLEGLLARFPYDASLHYGIDELIESAEGLNAADDELIRKLNAQQLPLILASLKGTGTVTNADHSGVVQGAQLMQDALRCTAQLRANGKRKEAGALLETLQQIAAGPLFAQSSQRPEMQTALRRHQMVGRQSPSATMHANLMTKAGSLQPHTLGLRGKPIVLIVVALSAPVSIDVVSKMGGSFKGSAGKAAPAVVCAVTSYGANGGDEGNPVPGMTQGLRGLAQALPTPLYLVKDAFLQQFAVDRSPMAIALDADGTVTFLAPLVTAGDERLLRDAVIPRKPEAIVEQVAGP